MRCPICQGWMKICGYDFDDGSLKHYVVYVCEECKKIKKIEVEEIRRKVIDTNDVPGSIKRVNEEICKTKEVLDL